jgi:hypothetical protein
MKLIHKVLIFTIITGIFFLTGCKETKESSNSGKKSAEITGVVMIYGNEPHTFAGIKSDDGRVFMVDEKHQKEFAGLQGEHYRFTGYIETNKGETGSLFIPVKWEIIK